MIHSYWKIHGAVFAFKKTDGQMLNLPVCFSYDENNFLAMD